MANEPSDGSDHESHPRPSKSPSLLRNELRESLLKKWGLTEQDLDSREPSLDINRDPIRNLDELLAWLIAGRSRACRLGGYAIEEAQHMPIGEMFMKSMHVEKLQYRCQLLINDAMIYSPKFGLQPSPELSDVLKPASDRLDLAILWLENSGTKKDSRFLLDIKQIATLAGVSKSQLEKKASERPEHDSIDGRGTLFFTFETAKEWIEKSLPDRIGAFPLTEFEAKERLAGDN
jgi:hypothetical protein